MNPFVTATIIAAWLVALFFAWAFVHGAQILRRREIAGLVAAEQERALDEPAAVTSIAPEPGRIPYAA